MSSRRPMRTEADVRKLITPVLADLHGHRVESSTMPGIPDLNYAQGWLELKVFRPYPAGSDEFALCREPLKPQQRAWLLARSMAGGRAYVLVAACYDDEWLLLDGAWAARCLERVTIDAVRRHALRIWRGSLDLKTLKELLK